MHDAVTCVPLVVFLFALNGWCQIMMKLIVFDFVNWPLNLRVSMLIGIKKQGGKTVVGSLNVEKLRG